MDIRVKNVFWSLSFSLTLLKLFGVWEPEGLNGLTKTIFNIYTHFFVMFIIGIYIIVQFLDLLYIWGDLTLMTGTAFLLFTNVALFTKTVNLIARRPAVRKIVDEVNRELLSEHDEKRVAIVVSCNRESKHHLILYIVLTAVTVLGWAASAEKDSLPLRAWYPYDTSQSPAYQITYAHQSFALIVSAFLNVSMDTLVTSLIAQCRCRLMLLGHSLRNLCRGVLVNDMQLISSDQDKTVSALLRECVLRHRAVLETVTLMEEYFSAPILVQFTVSTVIICVTAYQLTFETMKMVRVISMLAYLLDMMLQVFFYCYQGNQLLEESIEVAGAAYTCQWYSCPLRVQRALLVLMTRTMRIAKLTAGGFTNLSLSTFMAIIKASYTFFTVLQQVEGRKA